jgi:hypothetical protein
MKILIAASLAIKMKLGLDPLVQMRKKTTLSLYSLLKRKKFLQWNLLFFTNVWAS